MYPAHKREDGIIQSCAEHSVNTAVLTCSCLESICLNNTGYLAGLLHDCGKFTDEFSDYLNRAASGKTVRRGSVIHTFAAVSFFLKNYHKSENEYFKLTSEILAYADGSHHGLFDCYNNNSESGFKHRIEHQIEYDSRAVAGFIAECTSKEEVDSLFKKSANEIAAYIDSLLVMCEKGNRKYSDFCFLLSLLVRMLTSAVVDSDRRDTAAFMKNKKISPKPDMPSLWRECIEQLTDYLDAFPAQSEMQIARRALSDLCAAASKKETGIYRLNLPTGGGKTLSSLRFAISHALHSGKERIFYISPLLSILDQNAEVIKKAIGHDEIILEQHSDIINEGKTCEEIEEYEFLTDTWDSPIVITTLVQFLNTVFSGKMSSVRRFNTLKNSVVIIDEVQTVPGKMLTLFNLALDFLSKMCGTTFILCSATQPELREIPYPLESEELISKESLKKYDSIFKRNVIKYKGYCKLEKIPCYIAELLMTYLSVLVVCNKKSESATLFSTLQDTDVKCFHLSAGMCMAHRKNVLEQIRRSLAAHEKIICISTQVIEAGVDISFDAVIRLSAGMDSIIQSAGRCNRNGDNKEDAPVWVINCSDEKLLFLKEISDAKSATEALLDSYVREPSCFDNDLSSEKSIEFFYKKLFAAKSTGYFDYMVSGYSIYSMLSDNRQWLAQSSGEYSLNQAFRSAGDAFKVFDSEQKSVITPWGEGKIIIDKLQSSSYDNLKELMDAAKPYTVSVFDYQYGNLFESGAIQLFAAGTIAALSENYYDNNTGIKEVNNECNTQIW